LEAPQAPLPPDIWGSIVPADHPCAPEEAPPCLGTEAPSEAAPAARTTRFYGSAEYLYWWIRNSQFPPLVTTGSPAAPQVIQGTLGQDNTVLLFGGSSVDNEGRSGGRFTLGYWFDTCCPTAVEGSGFFLAPRSVRFAASSASFPVLARPVIDAATGQEKREINTTPITSPGGILNLSGKISVEAPSRLWGTEVNLRRQLCCGCNYHVDLLAGFRYLDLAEGLHVSEDVTSNAVIAGVPAFDTVGNRILVVDRFDTRNRFAGGQVGASGEYCWNRWSIEATGKVALGDTHQTLDILGNQLVIRPAPLPPSTFAGGLLALNSNGGRHLRDQFSVVPEVGLKLGYHVTNSLKVFVGYNFLFWSDVIRPGDQVDRTVDVNRVPNFLLNPGAPTTARPLVPFRETSFWAQGVICGLEWRY
jgi:hypothetical protein